jgi:putative DNA primase/helicase
VTEGIKAELDRENIHAQANPTNGKQIGFVPIVDTRLVSNTLEHLRSLTLLPPDTEQPSWLDGAPLFYPPWNPRDVLPTKTGLVNLRYMAEGMPGASHPPTPAFFESHALSYGFDPNAPEPVNWLTFLGARKPAPGCRINPLWPNDPESIATLQEWIGYLLTTDTSYQKIMMLIGPARCGKGTIAEVIRLLIGPESVANPTLKALTTEFGLQPLIGKPVAIITDARITSHYHMDTQAAIERLLSISGGDAQTINRKNKPHWSGRLPTRFMVMANAFPYFPDASGAIASRMILLQLKRSWLGEENRELLEALTDELPGILRWALNGAQRLRAHGRFSQPESARAALKEFGHATSSINAFLAECAVVHPEARVRRDDLFAAWKEWCTEQGIEKPGTQEQLGRNLRAALPELETTQPSVDGARVRFYVGLELR